MSRKDYERLAGVIRRTLADSANIWVRTAMLDTIIALSAELEKDNPHFDRRRFHLACCGLELPLTRTAEPLRGRRAGQVVRST